MLVFDLNKSNLSLGLPCTSQNQPKPLNQWIMEKIWAFKRIVNTQHRFFLFKIFYTLEETRKKTFLCQKLSGNSLNGLNGQILYKRSIYTTDQKLLVDFLLMHFILKSVAGSIPLISNFLQPQETHQEVCSLKLLSASFIRPWKLDFCSQTICREREIL